MSAARAIWRKKHNMPLDIRMWDGRNPMMNNTWKNDTGQRIFLDAEKEHVVPESEGHFLLVGVDGNILMEDAMKYGLVDSGVAPADDPNAVDESRMDAKEPEVVEDESRTPADSEKEKAQAPARDKAQQAPERTKS